ncbi:PEP/pyruvate-binding domain-containing protein [Actinomadura kijaniata]|uniref:PEP/pyruvate-binding domain-containing protein n=1 Tax=Actinomadura kijaniata TaxID=46161 RepID=UPI0008303F8B|nr:PEP/pyruvate-binding domain-containing protein [Actinomadura kijaniata]
MAGEWVVPLGGARVRPDVAGATGASLERLTEAGLPVPTGFLVTSGAYWRYVDGAELQPRILRAVAALDPEEAERRIAALFAAHDLPDDLAGQIRWAYADLGAQDHAVAVRAASAWDLGGAPIERPEALQGGRLATLLDVRGEAAVLAAVRDAWASLWSARAIDFRNHRRIDHEFAAVGVVVQSMVAAEAGGTLCTSAPGDAAHAVVHAVWGGGAAVVERRTIPDVLVLDRRSRRIVARRVAAKSVRALPDGTFGPQPAELRTRPVLTPGQAAELARFGDRVEQAAGRPMRVEWAWADDHPYLIRARPMDEHRAAGDGDGRPGDRAWSRGGIGEAVPDVMTPCTWSLVRTLLDTVGAASGRRYGNLGGHLYTSLDPEPRAPAHLVGAARARLDRRRIPGFLASAPDHCDNLRRRVRAAGEPRKLVRLWNREIRPYFLEACRVAAAAGLDDGEAPDVFRRLERLVGTDDANAVFAGLRAAGKDPFAVFGPVTGLARAARGDLAEDGYLRRWGHRSAHEFEVAMPRPAEEPGWVARWSGAPGPDALDLLAERRAAVREAWLLLRARHPHRVTALRRGIGAWAEGFHLRAAVRSEVARVFGVLRAFVLRAGEVTALGDAVFFLTAEEIVEVLGGDGTALRRGTGRRRAYERYRMTPDPQGANVRADGMVIMSATGTGGTAEGVVRVLHAVEEGDALRPGEILVAPVANVGWTPLFPRAAAVVTNVGAPFSEAAVVARELGVPAVVGAESATTLLRTGDRVRLDAARGLVRLVTPVDRPLTTAP